MSAWYRTTSNCPSCTCEFSDWLSENGLGSLLRLSILCKIGVGRLPIVRLRSMIGALEPESSEMLGLLYWRKDEHNRSGS